VPKQEHDRPGVHNPSDLDIQSDLKLIASVIQYGSEAGDLPLRDPAVDTILRRLGLDFGSFSVVIEQNGANTLFSIPEKAMMLGFDAESESVRTVKDQILSQSAFGYKLKGSHLAGYQLHQFLTGIHQYFNSVYHALVECRTEDVSAEYAQWRDRVCDQLSGGDLTVTATLKSIDRLEPEDFWKAWGGILDSHGIPSHLEKTVADAERQAGEFLIHLRRANRFRLLQSVGIGQSPLPVKLALYATAFLASCLKAQQILWPWSRDQEGGDWKGAAKFLFERWFVTNMPQGFRIVGERELSLKYAITQVATELNRTNALADRTDAYDRVRNDLDRLYLAGDSVCWSSDEIERASSASDEALELERSVALDLWDVELDRLVSGQRLSDKDILAIAGILKGIVCDCAGGEGKTIQSIVDVCFRHLDGKDPKLLAKVADYRYLLPVSVEYRPKLKSRTQVIVPVALGGELVGIFIAASTQPARAVESRLEAGGVDLITRAFTLPYAWHEISAVEKMKQDQARVKVREAGWRHWVGNRHVVIKEMIGRIREMVRMGQTHEIHQWLENLSLASQELGTALDYYGHLVSFEEVEAPLEWIDLEELVRQAANMISADLAWHPKEGCVRLDPVSASYAKVLARRAQLTATLKELALNAYKHVRDVATPESPGRISLSLSCDSQRERVYLSVANTGEGFPDIPVTDHPDEAIVAGVEDWDTVPPTEGGLSNVWRWIREELGGDITADLFRYRCRVDRMIVMGIRLSGEPSCLSFTPGDRD